MQIRSYRDLKVWQRSMDLVVNVYRLTGRFPDHEKFGLISQARRSAVSVPSNIAEGHRRGRTGQFLHHISIAQGSLGELETQLLISARLEYVTMEEVDEVLKETAEISRMLHGLANSLEKHR